MRGLKLMPNYSKQLPLMSHLLQMRGLKRQAAEMPTGDITVASFTDAWIETDHC